MTFLDLLLGMVSTRPHLLLLLQKLITHYPLYISLYTNQNVTAIK